MIRRTLLIFAANVVLFTLLRVAFLLVFGHHLAGNDLLRAFYLGLKFDARIAALVVAPMAIFGTRRAATIVVAVFELIILLCYAIDFGSYAYVHQRVNASELEFLRNPLISLHMVWESYHVVWFGLGILLFLAALVFALRGKRDAVTAKRDPLWQRIALIVFLLACIYGKASRYPLRWSDAYVARDPFAAELALNPPQFLFETMREEPVKLDEDRVRRLYPVMAAYAGVDRPDPKSLSLARTPRVFPQTSGTPNVVVIQLESFAAFKSGAFGNRANGCPNVDRLAREGLLFTNYYSPSEKTARALYAAVFGMADVSPWQAAGNNPMAVDQYTIINAFRGYEKYFFLGGSANWSNIRGMLAHNIDGLKIFEEGSYKAKPVDVWGVTDEEVFLAASDEFSKQRKPFFALILTSGNHRPYTVPKETHGYAREILSNEDLRANGFESNDEYNSFRYLDHAVGLFLEKSKNQPWFKNTVFVLYGDHGTRTGAPGEALTLGDLSLIVYHVPMIIYAPGFNVPPRRIDMAASHMDLMPTIASFCGVPYRNQTLGIDLFDPSSAARSAAFVFTTFRQPPTLGLVEGARYTIVKSGTSNTLPEAFYEFSRWLMLHNKP
ncbi:MAG TPA: LTA synthase family protein [Thermoanaerobaculia bacterium]|nr:LTA synthase family protein [Thermoanaerobaculia bacterium]